MCQEADSVGRKVHRVILSIQKVNTDISSIKFSKNRGLANLKIIVRVIRELRNSNHASQSCSGSKHPENRPYFRSAEALTEQLWL
jgi:hypothetical protein